MDASRKLIAQILETSAAGFAGMAASLLVERDPEVEGRYAPDGFTSWKTQMHQWLLDLSAAVDAGQSELFVARARSSKRGCDRVD